ncbi:hypothetical protein KIH27_02895 [Mycobacterium sp. M1]|uniref:Uncharacterized protein n=1 Tax=Mycolicibacter acidiphilus TaxID=2835306 RepID=A0ABS5RE24_9MYCO|nr:hypothetical protein [Mycolicibacter acidiphilus]MBS9532531.1 hypothetical protein [Mycolicibacter acidiphilus]
MLSAAGRTVNRVADLPDLLDGIRDEQLPADCLLLRGGPDSVEKLLRHAERTRRMFCLDGDPVLGISMFAAIDDMGPDSLDGLLAGQLATYRLIHTVQAEDLMTAGFRVVPTFRRPHVTVLVGSINEIPALLAALGPTHGNDHYGGSKHWRSTDDRR